MATNKAIILIFVLTHAGKAPPLPDANDATPRFRLTNKTAYNWKLKNSVSLFPQELASGDNKLIKLKEKQAPVQAIYTIRIKDKGESEETFEFQFKLAKNEGVYELLVDWMNLTSVKGIKLKPDSSSSNQPTKLGANEMTIEMDISSWETNFVIKIVHNVEKL